MTIIIFVMMPNTTPHTSHVPCLMATFNFSGAMSNCFPACVPAEIVTIFQCGNDMDERTPSFEVPNLG